MENVDLKIIENIAMEAGLIIMEVYSQSSFDIEIKNDMSPITEADLMANEYICKKLNEYYEDIPVLSEENQEIEYETRKGWKRYFCVDPLDGTKEFIKKNNEFTVNIALIEDNQPVLGVVYAPALDILYSASVSLGAFKNKNPLALKENKDKLVIALSRSHVNNQTLEYIKKIKSEKEIVKMAIGSSLKLCYIAEGIIDLYPKIGKTMEWDTAAADAVLRACGKGIFELDDNNPINYNKESLINPNYLVK